MKKEPDGDLDIPEIHFPDTITLDDDSPSLTSPS